MYRGFLLRTSRGAPYVLLTVVILLAAVRVSTASVTDRELRSAAVAEGYLPVRSSPTLVTATIAQLFRGDTVNLTGIRSADGRWVQVKMAGVDAGWIPADAIRVRFPILELAVTDDPALALGQDFGGVAVVTAEISPALGNAGPSGDVVAQFAQGDQVELAGFRTADGRWIQVVLPDGRVAWVNASSISSDFPLSALSEVDAITGD